MSTATIEIAPHIRAAYDAAMAKLAPVNERIQNLTDQLASSENQIAELSAGYESACRAIAAGEKADPQAINSQLELVRMRRSGQEKLLAEANAEAQPLGQAVQRALEALEAEKEAQAEAELLATHENLARAVKAARESLAVAEKEFGLSLTLVIRNQTRKASKAALAARERQQNAR